MSGEGERDLLFGDFLLLTCENGTGQVRIRTVVDRDCFRIRRIVRVSYILDDIDFNGDRTRDVGRFAGGYLDRLCALDPTLQLLVEKLSLRVDRFSGDESFHISFETERWRTALQIARNLSSSIDGLKRRNLNDQLC